MAQILNQPGRYKAKVISSNLKGKEDSKVWMLAIKFGILSRYNEETKEWDSWEQYEPQEKYANINIVQKNGELNEIACKNLNKCFGWTGDMAQLDNLESLDKIVQIVVDIDAKRPEAGTVVLYINPENYEGSEVKKVDPATLKTLNAQFGSKLRAMLPKAASVAANKPTNAAKPAVDLVSQEAESLPTEADIPF